MMRFGLFALVVALFCAAALRDGVDRWVEATELPVVLAETSVEIRDRNGDLLRAYTVEDGIWRLAVQPDQVDAGFIAMLQRYEDKRFQSHNGVDPLALLRAIGQAIWHGGRVSGGSTLTMQVARLIEDGSTGRWSGKLRQIRVALALEQRLSKQEILRLYLTHAPYGANLEGVRAASLAWFGKEPHRLTPSESALLVALPQSPQARRPDRHPERARAARDRVLQRLAGQGALADEEVRAALRSDVPRRMRPFPRFAPHLADRLRAGEAGMARHDVTLDAQVQRAMEQLARNAARSAGARVSAAMVVADHETGEILASVGSAAYDGAEGRGGFVDMTRALRSPGSTLKPLIYGMAFYQGLAHPETLIHDGPVSFSGYAPRNFDNQFRGDLRLREALQLSLNIPVVKLTDALGPARVMAALRRSGAQTRLRGQPGLAISLGGLGISLHDLVQLYAGLAQGGQARPLFYETLRTDDAGRDRVIGAEAAWMVADVLSGLTPPPGAPPRTLAYKTGTSYGHRDAWAIGFDGQHVIGVWLGRADGTPVPGAFGGELAAPVLFEAFGRLKPDFARLPPPPPATLMVSTAALPVPLRRFEVTRNVTSGTPLKLSFPPDGAKLILTGDPVVIKLQGGQGPFAVLANGKPVALNTYASAIELSDLGRGYSTLVVVDQLGNSDRVTVQLE